MKESTQELQITGLSDYDLLRELCDRVEFVAVGGWALPNNPTIELAIRNIKIMHAEVERRGMNCLPRIVRLGEQRRWHEFQSFFSDCLAFPERIPYVREADGIRRVLRCRMCRTEEHPPGALVFKYCGGCMERVLSALHDRTGCEGIFIFRTYSPECRCAHADNDTVLACELCTDNIVGVCERCIREEIERRNTV